MIYAKYLKPKQSLLLQTVSELAGVQNAQFLTATVIGCGEEVVEVTVPYAQSGREGVGFRNGQRFSILSECFGVGMKITSLLIKVTGKVLQLKLDDLEFICRRAYPRCDIMARFSCIRHAGPLDVCGEKWLLASQKLADGILRSKDKMEAMTVNVSAGGVYIPLKPPVQKGELCLLFLELGMGKISTWTVAEVIWSNALDSMLQWTGLRFVNIIVDHREKINKLVLEELKRQGSQIDWSLSKPSALNRMHF